MAGKLLGHRKVQTTVRYVYLAWDFVTSGAERISDSFRATSTALRTFRLHFYLPHSTAA